MSHQYPRKMGGQGCNASQRPGCIGKPCDECGRLFTKKDYVVVQETQVNWFRGDDEVKWFCIECWDKSGQSLANDRGCCGTRRNKPHKPDCKNAMPSPTTHEWVE